MNRIIAIVIVLFLTGLNAQAQKRVDIGWKSQPDEIRIDDAKWSPYGAVFIFNQIKSEYQRDDLDIKHTKYVHRRIRLYNEEAVAAFNTLRIPYTEEYNISNFKARSIHADGSVTDLKQSDIGEAKEEGILLKLIAFENLNIGDDIEYSYEWNFPAAIYEEVDLNTGLSTLSSYFEVDLGKDMDIDLMSYNGVDVYSDTTVNNTVVYAEQKNIVDDDEELFSFPSVYTPRIEYTISYPGSKFYNKERTWNDYNPVITKEAYIAPMVDKNLRKLARKIDMGSKEEDRIFAIEDYLKTNYDIVPDRNDGTRSIRDLLTSNEWTEDEFVGTMAALIYAENIDFKIGFTTDRSEKQFDPNFVNSKNMEFVFFYFPKYDKYMMPSAQAVRYSYMPSLLRGNKSVLFDLDPNKPFKVHSIPYLSADKNYHNHDVKMSVDPQAEKVKIDSRMSMTGDTRANNLPYIMLLDETSKKSFLEEITKLDDGEDKMEDITLTNDNWKSLYEDKPLIIHTVSNSSSLLQKVAENEYLVNVGAVIGRQAELPQRSHERIYDVDMNAPHALMRKISFELPAGFSAVNISDLEIDKSLEVNGKKICYFKSTATQNGNNIMIDIAESYDQEHIDKKYYDGFREVINAAAEFNKLDILISKN